MSEDNRIKRVRFVDEKVFESYRKLKTGTSEEKLLAENLDKAIGKLKLRPSSGIKIPSRLWPKEYSVKYGISNLWKYDLASGWRLVYTIAGNEVEVISIILEWFSHKNYEKRFKYNVK